MFLRRFSVKTRQSRSAQENWTTQKVSEIAQIYAQPASLKLTERNPIVFIPGIMGSKLVNAESAQSVWGDFSRSYADPKQRENRCLIALPMEYGSTLDRLVSTVEADGAVSVARPRRLPITVGAYRDILQTMGVGTGLPVAKHRPEYNGERFSSFEFGYDWRRSLDEIARNLDRFLELATYFVQGVRGNSEPVKFNIVAHSMGGLVLRYYLRYGTQRLPYDGTLPRITWAGSERVAKAILIGTPNAGSAMAIERLVNGLPSKHLVHPGFDPCIVGTMPAIYQLLPRARHQPFMNSNGTFEGKLFDPSFWEYMGWGLAGPHDDLLAIQLEGVDSAQKRREVALEHLAKCLGNAEIFHSSLDISAKPPTSLELHIFAGDAINTASVVTGEPSEGKVRVIQYGAGDGTVLRSSALLDERVGGEWQRNLVTPISWKSVTFSTSKHLALTRDRIVLDNVLFRLFEQ